MDEELMEQISIAVSEESERLWKFGAAYQRNLRPGGQIHSKKTGAKEETIPNNH